MRRRVVRLDTDAVGPSIAAAVFRAGVQRLRPGHMPQVPGLAGSDGGVAPGADDAAGLDERGPALPFLLVLVAVASSGGVCGHGSPTLDGWTERMFAGTCWPS